MSEEPFDFELDMWEAIPLEDLLEEVSQKTRERPWEHDDEPPAPSPAAHTASIDPADAVDPGFPSPPPSGTMWHIRDGIRPVDLYAYLNARFGRPNGLAMLGKNCDDSDNLIHWHYTLRAPAGRIEFFCFSFRVEVLLSFKCDASSQDLLDRIKGDFKRVARQLGEVRARFEKWQLLLNPYFRLKSMIEGQLEELESLKLDEVEEPGFPRTGRDVERFQQAFNLAANKFSTASRISLTVRMLAPVWAESFVNLLLFLLARPEVRTDRRLYDSILRQNIDIRVRGLHLNCVGFATQVPYEEWEACKRFHTMMMGRNDMLHGNVDPRLYAFYDVFFEHRTPLFTSFEDFGFFTYKASMINALPEQALSDYQAVQDFAAHILICLEPGLQDEVRRVVLSRDIGWDADRRVFGILFPDHLVDFHAEPASEKQDDAADSDSTGDGSDTAPERPA